jgi:hypothetical protein
MTYAGPAWEFAADNKIAAPAEQGTSHIWQFSKAHPGSRFTRGFPFVYEYIAKLCRQLAEIIQNHYNENVRNTRQGEANHR